MSIILPFVITLIFLLSFKYRIKGVNSNLWFYIFIIVLMIVLFGGNNDNLDYHAYSTMFYGRKSDYSSTEFLYYGLMHIFSKMGTSYEVFNLFLIALALIILSIAAYSYIGFSIEFAFLYFLWPAFIDWLQIRNMVAMSFITLALAVLGREEGKKKYLGYIILIIIAMGFHTGALAYLPIVFVYGMRINSRQKNIFMALCAAAAIAISIPSSGVNIVINILYKIFGANDFRVNAYSSNMVRIGFLMNWMIQIALYIFAVKAEELYNRYSDDGLVYEKYFSLISRTMLYMFIFFPIYRLNTNFLRLTRNLIPSFHIIFVLLNGCYIKSAKNSFYKEILSYDICYIAFIVAVMVVQLLIPHYIDLIIPLFEKRWLL